ncbi:MAG: AraC family transcriptional regulator [Myxococcales bacterium FL481]|nr:MAG: AraC family transcriptional regulator [Myxococcales bacterium FL481]
MGRITSLFVHKVIEQVDASLDKAALLRSVGVDPTAPIDPKVMVSATDYYAYLEAIAARDPQALDLPLRVGASMRLDEYGAMGLAWKAAANLRASWDRAERFAKVLTSVTTYEVREVNLGAWLVLHRDGERRLGLRLSNEASIASLAAISRQVTQAPLQLLEVTFEHAVPGRADLHERHFGCPVRFGAPDDALLVAWNTLQFPNRLSDPGISRFFEAHLAREVEALDDGLSLEQRVRNDVSRAICDGIPTLSETGQRLGMSSRTLQRRLASGGSTYQQLIDEARRQLAERLLAGTAYSLQEVAFLTGFSEQSAFTRAFKRWAGQTPRSFRLSAQT